MAGNANSGNHNGRLNLSDRVRKAMVRAMKQGESGVGGQRPLSDLLAQLMQEDVAKFIQITGPYIPKELIVDHQISIISALDEARQRIIDLNPDLLQHNQPLTLTHSATDAELIEVVQDSQGEV